MKALLRFETGPSIGVGHAMRSATLGEALLLRGHEVLAVAEGASGLVVDRFRSAGIELRTDRLSSADTSWLLDDLQPDLVVVDGYGLVHVLEVVVTRGVTLLVIDDNFELPVAGADIVVNQNLHAASVPYPLADNTVWLLGARYALLRTDVLELGRERRELVPERADRSQILIAMGGSDPARLTRPLVQRLLQSVDADLMIAMSEDHVDGRAVGRMIAVAPDRAERADATLISSLRRADLAVVGGGSTMWETAHLGIPAVAAVVAENQVEGSRAAASAGFVETVDARALPPEQVADRLVAAVDRIARDEALRDAMAAAGRSTFDGLGAGRIVDAIESVT